jgi:glutamine synthetase
VNIFHDEHKNVASQLEHLPASCYESAQKLEQQRHIYEKYGVFSKSMIDGTIKKLLDYNDQKLREEIHCNKEKILKLVQQYFHCG